MTAQEKIQKLKGLGVDIEKSEWTTMREPEADYGENDGQDATTCKSEEQRYESYIEELTKFIRSLEFMRLGQSISHKQWQAAAMKATKLTKEVQRLGIIGFERPMTGVRQNVNRKNAEEALQALSLIINKRVKMLEILGVAK